MLDARGHIAMAVSDDALGSLQSSAGSELVSSTILSILASGGVRPASFVPFALTNGHVASLDRLSGQYQSLFPDVHRLVILHRWIDALKA